MLKPMLSKAVLLKVPEAIMVLGGWLILAATTLTLLIYSNHPALFQQWKQPDSIKLYPHDQAHQQQRAEVSLHYQTTPLALLYLASHHLTLGNMNEAEDLLQTAKHLAPNDPLVQRFIRTHFHSQQ